VTLFSVHTPGSRDEMICEKAAALLDLELRSSSVGEREIAQEIRSLDLPFAPSQMDQALWCIYSTAARLARLNGAEVLLLGQLADELFGGYLKYSEELEVNGEVAASEMMKRDVLECSSRAFIRDETACGTWIEPRFPFANEELANFALALPIGYKISAGGRRKVILRDAASRLDLPEELTQSPKKAAQYSSGVLKQVAKLSLL
jgi:asparagine synthase (glutamine-hydrolysing)